MFIFISKSLLKTGFFTNTQNMCPLPYFIVKSFLLKLSQIPPFQQALFDTEPVVSPLPLKSYRTSLSQLFSTS